MRQYQIRYHLRLTYKKSKSSSVTTDLYPWLTSKQSTLARGLSIILMLEFINSNFPGLINVHLNCTYKFWILNFNYRALRSDTKTSATNCGKSMRSIYPSEPRIGEINV